MTSGLEKEAEVTKSSAGESIPVARLEPRGSVWTSRMWWVTAVALIVAVGLIWQSMKQSGPTIVIQFPDGHGLKEGDFVRHRGIDVGHVDRIELSEDLQQVRVTVTLLHGADGLARQGTQFWIVRPELRLTEVRGLDTALGAKYIAVIPGPADAPSTGQFTGLVSAPAGDLDHRGVEVVLRGENSRGLYAGAPVNWRGVEVGEVLRVDLASDTRYVDVHARVDLRYRTLIRSNSKFWMSSGLGIDAGLTGFSLKADSLMSIARGGISFITPAGKEATDVQPGHVFVLHEKEDASWTASNSTVGLIDFDLPRTVNVRSQWKQSTLGFQRTKEVTSCGILTRGSEGKTMLLAPADVMRKPESAVDNTWNLQVLMPGQSAALATVQQPESHAAEGLLRSIELPDSSQGQYDVIDFPKGPLGEPEDCCLVRSVAGGQGPSEVIHSVSRMQLHADPQGWRVDGGDKDLADWNGAVVISAVDGRVLGLLVSGAQGSMVVAGDAESR